jgi:hypothetical protein
MVALVNRLKSRGVPIDGIGSQTHISLGHAGTIAANLQTLANTGLDVAITELDIASSTSTANEAQQSSDYETVAKACLAVSRCVGITTWGVSDKVCSRGCKRCARNLNPNIGQLARRGEGPAALGHQFREEAGVYGCRCCVLLGSNGPNCSQYFCLQLNYLLGSSRGE